MIRDNAGDTERSDTWEGLTKEGLALLESTPYIHKTFKKYDDAAIFQRAELTRLIGEGFSVREAALSSDFNFDTKVDTWYVFIRCYPKYKLVASQGS